MLCAASASSASLIHCSLLISTEFAFNDATAVNKREINLDNTANVC